MKCCTVLMCTYNAEKYIIQQLDSLRKQTYKDMRVIIYDDMSTDATVGLIAEYMDKYTDLDINLHVNSKNSGGAKENFRAITADYADAEYVCYCDQDDIWNETKIEKMMNKMVELEAKRMQPYIVCHDCLVVDEHENTILESIISDVSLKHLIYHPAIQGCCMMLNRPALKIMDIEYAEIGMHDWYASLVVSANGHIEVMRDDLIKYRQHGNNQVGYSRKSLKTSIKMVLKPQDKINRYKIIVNQLYSVSKVSPENELLIRYKRYYENHDFKKVIKLFKEYNVFDKNVHGLYQSIVSYMAMKSMTATGRG